MKTGKTGRSLGILQETVKVACQDLDIEDLLLKLVHTTWRERNVPKDWTDTVIMPIPKKTGLSHCNIHYWRGIFPFDAYVMGKVVTRIVQDRHQQLVEEELPDSQCGFHQGQRCSNIIFAIRQLVAMSMEHKATIFFLIIDLQKAYDSLPCEVMW